MCANETEGSVIAGGFEPVGKPVDHMQQPASSRQATPPALSQPPLNNFRVGGSTSLLSAGGAPGGGDRKVIKYNEEVNADWDQFR